MSSSSVTAGTGRPPSRGDPIASPTVAIFVVLSITLVVAILGVLGVVGLHLLRTVGSLRAAGEASRRRLQPLTEELQAEAAVASLESEALQRSLQALRDSRAPRKGIPSA